jgi:hypothetical protein
MPAPEPDPKLVAIVADKTAALADSEAWAAIAVAAGGYGIRNRGLCAFRDAVWLARKAAERLARAERVAGKAAAREKSLAAVRRRAERQKRRHVAAGAAASNAADVLGAFQVEGTP